MILDIFGQITPPTPYGGITDSGTNAGLVGLVNNLLGLITAVAGVFVLINLVLAGYQYLSSNGEPQKVLAAGNKILQSAIGIGLVAVAYVIAAIVGKILFDNPIILLQPQLFSIL